MSYPTSGDHPRLAARDAGEAAAHTSKAAAAAASREMLARSAERLAATMDALATTKEAMARIRPHARDQLLDGARRVRGLAEAQRRKHRRLTVDPTGSLVHPALFYADDEFYLEGTVPFLREGLEAGQPVMIAAPPTKLDLVRAALGPAASKVVFHDMTLAGRNPGRIIAGVLRAFVDEHADRGRVRIIGEPIWAGRSPAEYAAAVQHEALINVALADCPATVLCLYDTTALDPGAVADAARTHPILRERGVSSRSEYYAEPVELAGQVSGPLAAPAEIGETLVFAAPIGPRAVRIAVAEHAQRAGLDEDKVADLCLAAYEVAVNTVVHTGRSGLLTLWTREPGRPPDWEPAEPAAVVCEVQDSGWIPDPLVGRHPCGPADGRGYGLRLAHQLCDLVQVHTDASLGTTVRMTMRLEMDTPHPEL